MLCYRALHIITKNIKKKPRKHNANLFNFIKYVYIAFHCQFLRTSILVKFSVQNLVKRAKTNVDDRAHLKECLRRLIPSYINYVQHLPMQIFVRVCAFVSIKVYAIKNLLGYVSLWWRFVTCLGPIHPWNRRSLFLLDWFVFCLHHYVKAWFSHRAKAPYGIGFFLFLTRQWRMCSGDLSCLPMLRGCLQVFFAKTHQLRKVLLWFL